MVNGDYWIYSDRNGQTILARCEGTALWFVDKVVQNSSNSQKANKRVGQSINRSPNLGGNKLFFTDTFMKKSQELSADLISVRLRDLLKRATSKNLNHL